MKNYFVNEKIKYDGSQLQPLYAYLNYGVLGDSIIAWVGACHVDFKHMIDGEDLIASAKIAGDEMLHFIVEIFHRELASGVLLQRLMASIVKDILEEKSKVLEKESLARDGDDLYWGDRKLSISIASKSSVSSQIHFAVNITNTGTPVKTCALQDFAVDAKDFALEVMAAVTAEWESIVEATQKVRPL